MTPQPRAPLISHVTRSRATWLSCAGWRSATSSSTGRADLRVGDTHRPGPRRHATDVAPWLFQQWPSSTGLQPVVVAVKTTTWSPSTTSAVNLVWQRAGTAIYRTECRNLRVAELCGNTHPSTRCAEHDGDGCTLPTLVAGQFRWYARTVRLRLRHVRPAHQSPHSR